MIITQSIKSLIFKILSLIFVFVVMFDKGLQDEVLHNLSDIYFKVTIITSGFLAVFYFAEHFIDIDKFLLYKKKLQVVASSIIGLLPGCGGSVIVIIRFLDKKLSFGCVVAALIATMGDASFLMMAMKPKESVILFSIVFFTAIITGFVVDTIHKNYSLPRKKTTFSKEHNHFHYGLHVISIWIMIVFIGLFLKFFKTHNEVFAAIAIGFIFIFWLARNQKHIFENGLVDHHCNKNWKKTLSHIIYDTNFITVWVVIGTIAYQILVHYTGFNIENFVAKDSLISPFIFAILGIIPSCGFAVVITNLYINNITSFASQLSYAISNNGDGIWAILINYPKTTIIAIFYNVAAAIVISYGYVFVVELVR